MEAVAAPRAHEPHAALALQLARQLALRRQRLLVEERVRERELPQRLIGGGRHAWVERHEDVARRLGQVLQQIDPIAHTHGGSPLRGGRVARLLLFLYAVPARPHLALARHEAQVGVQVDLVVLVLDVGQRRRLLRPSGLAQQRQRHVRVRRQHDVVEELLAVASRQAQCHAAPRASRHTLHLGTLMHLAAHRPQRCHARVDVRLRAPLEHAPHRPLHHIEQVVVDPEADHAHHGEGERVGVRARPDRRAHGRDIVRAKEGRVPSLLQVLAQRDALPLRVAGQHLWRLPAERDHLPDHEQELWRAPQPRLREDGREAA